MEVGEVSSGSPEIGYEPPMVDLMRSALRVGFKGRLMHGIRNDLSSLSKQLDKLASC
ncbi:MAG: hypothetical protein NZ992_05480 [Candidatus Korarchaeum sp.]|nr:hypothetical protein [Candidatus Korarchaeum sp.]MDW8035836.1 hypothetical protein [Candidatus Korarchaeum sp.]